MRIRPTKPKDKNRFSNWSLRSHTTPHVGSYRSSSDTPFIASPSEFTETASDPNHFSIHLKITGIDNPDAIAKLLVDSIDNTIEFRFNDNEQTGALLAMRLQNHLASILGVTFIANPGFAEDCAKSSFNPSSYLLAGFFSYKYNDENLFAAVSFGRIHQKNAAWNSLLIGPAFVTDTPLPANWTEATKLFALIDPPDERPRKTPRVNASGLSDSDWILTIRAIMDKIWPNSVQRCEAILANEDKPATPAIFHATAAGTASLYGLRHEMAPTRDPEDLVVPALLPIMYKLFREDNFTSFIDQSNTFYDHMRDLLAVVAPAGIDGSQTVAPYANRRSSVVATPSKIALAIIQPSNAQIKTPRSLRRDEPGQRLEAVARVRVAAQRSHAPDSLIALLRSINPMQPRQAPEPLPPQTGLAYAATIKRAAPTANAAPKTAPIAGTTYGAPLTAISPARNQYRDVKIRKIHWFATTARPKPGALLDPLPARLYMTAQRRTGENTFVYAPANQRKFPAKYAGKLVHVLEVYEYLLIDGATAIDNVTGWLILVDKDGLEVEASIARRAQAKTTLIHCTTYRNPANFKKTVNALFEDCLFEPGVQHMMEISRSLNLPYCNTHKSHLLYLNHRLEKVRRLPSSNQEIFGYLQYPPLIPAEDHESGKIVPIKSGTIFHRP